jgi:predicted N-acetyltransferase YhbS
MFYRSLSPKSTIYNNATNHSNRFYKEPCYYLDNLAVDFRFQRKGIGGVLVQWGLENARRLELSACTEAGPMSEGLYTKMGFQKVGDWTVPLPGREDLTMPVLRHPDP